LAGHDERARDILVLDEAFAVGQIQGHRTPEVKNPSQSRGSRE
jgi:hypothetical protein